MLVTRALSGLVGLALLASRLVCLLVLAWFVVFAVDSTSVAASHQVSRLYGASQQQALRIPAKQAAKEGAAKKALGEAGRALTAPFAGLTSGSSSAWLARAADTLLALLVYGLGVGFLVRIVRLRV
jgi:hypothetical protein